MAVKRRRERESFRSTYKNFQGDDVSQDREGRLDPTVGSCCLANCRKELPASQDNSTPEENRERDVCVVQRWRLFDCQDNGKEGKNNDCQHIHLDRDNKSRVSQPAKRPAANPSYFSLHTIFVSDEEATFLWILVPLGPPKDPRRPSFPLTKVLKIKFKLKAIQPKYPAETTERRKSQSYLIEEHVARVSPKASIGTFEAEITSVLTSADNEVHPSKVHVQWRTQPLPPCIFQHQ